MCPTPSQETGAMTTPQVADEKTKAQRGGVICPLSHSRKWDGRARIQPSLTWRDGS